MTCYSRFDLAVYNVLSFPYTCTIAQVVFYSALVPKKIYLPEKEYRRFSTKSEPSFHTIETIFSALLWKKPDHVPPESNWHDRPDLSPVQKRLRNTISRHGEMWSLGVKAMLGLLGP